MSSSDLSLPKTPLVAVAQGSLESILLNSTAIKRLDPNSKFITGGLYGGGGNIELSVSQQDPNQISEDGSMNSSITEKPQLADISVFSNELYVDTKGVTRARIVMKVKNSSGEELLGVDALLKNVKEGG
jgi:hypothetical protein